MQGVDITVALCRNWSAVVTGVPILQLSHTYISHESVAIIGIYTYDIQRIHYTITAPITSDAPSLNKLICSTYWTYMVDLLDNPKAEKQDHHRLLHSLGAVRGSRHLSIDAPLD
jgi:hypothetical protein